MMHWIILPLKINLGKHRDDLTEGKPTLPLMYAMWHGKESEQYKNSTVFQKKEKPVISMKKCDRKSRCSKPHISMSLNFIINRVMGCSCL